MRSFVITLLAVTSAFCCYGQGTAQTDTSWKKAAREMVQEQMIKRGIKDTRVIQVMLNTARHRFVPKDQVEYAYWDTPLRIESGQTISQPYIVGLMTELLELKGHEKVLEIGTGSGYQAAVLAALTDSVYTIEIVQLLADKAKERLQKLGYTNIATKWGDGYKGWPEHAPYDRIIVTAAPEEVPQALIDQLKVGGKMVIPVGKYYQDLRVITKTEEGLVKESVLPVLFVPMVHPKE